MALVQGEDSESDEEINTEHLHSLVLTPDGSLTGYHGLIKGISSQAKTAGIVMGEESETDEEDDISSSTDQTDGAPGQQQARPQFLSGQTSSSSSPLVPPREELLDSVESVPQSLLHKKLRERNQSLRSNIVERIIKLYRITCKNLTLVNNNLSKAQRTVETVNSNLKRSEHDLSELNTIISDINKDARFIAPNLSIQFAHSSKKSPSPMRQRLLKGIPQVYNLLGGTASKAPPHGADLHSEEQIAGFKITKEPPEARPEGHSSGATKIPEAHSEGQSSGAEAHPEGQGSGAKIPETHLGGQSSRAKIPEARPEGQGSGAKIPETHPGGQSSGAKIPQLQS